MAPYDLVGNASYILLATSYLVTNIYWLRVLAIFARERRLGRQSSS
jgi:uncharacterized membrane protein